MDLPGFYYDAERKRYFPLSSRSTHAGRRQLQEKTNTDALKSSPSPNVNTKVLQLVRMREVGCTASWGALCSPDIFQRHCIEAQTLQPMVWSCKRSVGSADGAVEESYVELQTPDGIKGTSVLTLADGNDFGICQVRQCEDINLPQCPHLLFPPSLSHSSSITRPPYLSPARSLLHLNSKVTAIKKFGKAFDKDQSGVVIFTTLGCGGEGGALYIMKLSNTQDQSWENGRGLPFSILRSTLTDCSVWTTAWCSPAKAALGTSKGAVLVDLERSSKTWLLHSKSDIFSQQCDSAGNVLFCGFRNGCISTLDVRAPLHRARSRRFLIASNRREASSSGYTACTNEKMESESDPRSDFGQRGKIMRRKVADKLGSRIISMRMQSAVCSMLLLPSNETYLLASSMSGDIKLWDRRLFEKGPVLTYDGNINTHSMLQLWVDASESVIASGGEDRTIRIWSLRSGRLLQTVSGLPAVVKTFSSPTELGKEKQKGCLEDHAWGVWLGSSAGVLYMHSTASRML